MSEHGQNRDRDPAEFGKQLPISSYSNLFPKDNSVLVVNDREYLIPTADDKREFYTATDHRRNHTREIHGPVRINESEFNRRLRKSHRTASLDAIPEKVRAALIRRHPDFDP